MMNKRNSIITGIAFSFMLIVGTTFPSYAQTKDFAYSLKVGDSETKFGATKAGGSSFETKYYLTQENVSRPTGSTRYFSYYPKLNGVRAANGLKLSEDDFKKHNNTYYSGKAIAGKKYKLYCKFTGSQGTNKVNTTVSGKWTP
ncbi:hypothetical protein [Eubacterium sp. An3]|uniref:hypothetical protein n=1 Tax=Eubacterium sp. An3 TaxID=1965628 RepID=UPI000B3AB7D1|nr:hypothetical protein [Eubacterium sp. An3]OUO27993.1 hypothetical protein B5F87_09185 [Eubacterium sp. An3]